MPASIEHATSQDFSLAATTAPTQVRSSAPTPAAPEPTIYDSPEAGPWPVGFLLSIVMPVFNERGTIEEIVRRVTSLAVPHELIIVDDGSSDGTRDVLLAMANRPGIQVLLHPRNRGKGAALRTGLAHAQGSVVAIQDADLEYDPGELPALVQPIVKGRADVVFGSRYLGGRPNSQRWRHRAANSLLTWLSNRCTGLNLTDMETCHKVFRGDAVADLKLEQDRFGIEPELTAKVARRGYHVIEMPIGYQGRDYAEGKKIRLRDAFQAVYCILRYALVK